MDEKEQEAYDAGMLAQRLKEFDKHFERINGSIEDTARELAKMNIELRDFDLGGSQGLQNFKQDILVRLETFSLEVRSLANDFRTFKEDYRASEVAVQSEKKTLALETKRLRDKLSDERSTESDSFMKRHSTAGLSLSIIALLLGLLYFLLSHS